MIDLMPACIRSVFAVKERGARERDASMSSGDGRNKFAHEALPYDIFLLSKHAAPFKTCRDDPSKRQPAPAWCSGRRGPSSRPSG